MEWPGIPYARTNSVSFVFALGSCGHAPNAGDERNDEPAQCRLPPDPRLAWRLVSTLVPGAFKLNFDCGKIETAAARGLL